MKLIKNVLSLYAFVPCFLLLSTAPSYADSTFVSCANVITKAINIRAHCGKHETRLSLNNLGRFGETGSQGPQGPQGPKGDTGNTGAAGVVGGSIASGISVYGLIGGRYNSGRIPASFDSLASLPGKTTQVFSDETRVQVANTMAIASACSNATCLSGEENDFASRCTGTPEVPTAPAGYVCIYPTGRLNAKNIVGFNLVDGSSVPTANATVPSAGAVGFGLGWDVVTTGDTALEAVWAYTAP